MLFFIICISSCTENKSPETKPVPTPKTFVPAIEYSIVGSSPHDINAFTEGLVFYNQQLYESTGSPENLPQTRSVIGPVDMKTGKIDVKVELDKSNYFGEGIVFIKDKLYQLTYQNKLGFIYDAKTFKQLGRFNFASDEGWGLTTDGEFIIMSDGTNVLTYIDPVTLKVIKTVNVTNAGYAEDYLNELEYINGFIYANIWLKNYVVKIAPATGEVVGILNLSELMDRAKSKNKDANVLNGIAYDAVNNKIYVTGKMWADLYEISFVH